MATPGKSNSPSDDPADDDEISLEEANDRFAQQRPRLPDQRRETKQFEMAAPAVPARQTPPGTVNPSAAPALQEDAGAGPDEIEDYDPSAAASGISPPAVRKDPVAQAKSSLQPTEGLDDLEEFIARTASDSRQEEKVVRERRPYSMVEKVCVGGGILVLLALGVWLLRAVASEANSVPEVSLPRPKLPMEGSLISISEASAGWRGRTDKDRVAEMEVILPIPQRQRPDLIPQVTFTVESGSKSGFLRFIFRDSFGKARGDTRVVQVENGSLKDMGRGEIITSSSSGSVYCSEGLQNLHAYHSYEADHVPRWSVEIAESASYGASDKEWKVLGTFDVRNELK